MDDVETAALRGTLAASDLDPERQQLPLERGQFHPAVALEEEPARASLVAHVRTSRACAEANAPSPTFPPAARGLVPAEPAVLTSDEGY